MKIIVKGADFSAIKIGTAIQIPDELKSAVTAFGTLSATKLTALIGLYNDLNNAGYWERLYKLYVPIMSDNLETSHVNIIDGNVDWIPNDYFAVNEYGLTNGSGSGVVNTGIPFSHALTDIATFKFSVSQRTFNDTSRCGFLGFDNSSNARLFYPSVNHITENGNTLDAMMQGAARSSKTLPKASTDNSLQLVGINNDGNIIFASGDVYEVSEYKVLSGNATKIHPYGYYTGGKSDQFNGSVSICGIMNAVTETEYKELNSIMYAFQRNLGM